jgi:hypothetical protein
LFVDLAGRLRLGDIDLDAGLQNRRGDHENDQQHEDDVDERDHVDLGQGRLSRSGCLRHMFLGAANLWTAKRNPLKGFFDLRGDFRRERVEALREHANVLQELIVENYGRDRDEKASGGGQKRFGNARRDRAKAGGISVTQARKSVDDAPDGAKKADERGNRTSGCEPGHTFFRAADFFRGRDLHVGGYGLKALEFWRLGGTGSVTDLALKLTVARCVNRSKRGTRSGEALRIGDATRCAKDAQEIIALATYAAKESELLKNHGPGDDRKQKKNRQDDARDPTGILENASEVDENDCGEQKNDFPLSKKKILRLQEP